jgi:hypothetical protein
MDQFVPVVTIPVNDRIDHAFSHSHADVKPLVLVETGFLGGSKDLFFGLIHAFERGRVVAIEEYFCAGFHRVQFPKPDRRTCISRNATIKCPGRNVKSAGQ